ncbi:1,4-alpha-glucan branching protein GlgB [Auraticoccus sp. F435]|uniref:1,4-alpha-glucan branching enzyme GlgB n=1 Tax=Auraticoccus cholistanensis TaxID=2656650 RepID=A0A6A9V0V3_9ACTN|nr:1,4-alpha-glucan branching protein GlgB [Auraticoccus cholistanensis]MVA76010.1 1,4-alpha-glucan branching protein GlgB [Auraticoccus cholistanensis]
MAHDREGGLRGWDFEGFHSGHDTEAWRRLGAHVITVADDERGSVDGTRFSVWAPNAQRVQLIADFNHYVPGDHELQRIPGSGVWALFVEGVGAGSVYKYRILGADGVWREKADPMARQAEGLPSTGSIVHASSYTWGDQEWLERRARSRPHAEPMSIYEVHLPSFRPGRTYADLAEELVEYVTWQGFTHVELIGVAHHPFLGSWGYQVTGYFAPFASMGTPDELRLLVDRLHQAGIGVIMDWVPGHFATDEWALANFDGTSIYEHPDPRRGQHLDWGTYIFDFGRNEVKSFLVSSALYWVDQFHIDGLRVDAVASMLYLDYSRTEWLPNRYGGREHLEAIELLQFVNRHLYERVPGVVTIAEESTSWPGVTRPVHEGGLGFGFKWNMGWMNDSLRYLGRAPVHRQYHHHEITFGLVYAFSENFVLPISHDEVVHGKGSMLGKVPEDDWRKFATLRAFYALQWSHPGKQLLFMGCEFGQRSEFSEDRGPDWLATSHWGHRGLQLLVRDLNSIYREHPALWQQDNSPSGFSWISADDAGGNVFSFLRYDEQGRAMACLINFSAEPRRDYRIGLPAEGRWREVLNTDAEHYDGTGEFGNLGAVTAVEVGSHGLPASATVTIPPLAAVWLVHDPVLSLSEGEDQATEEAPAPESAAAEPAAPEPVAPRAKRARRR